MSASSLRILAIEPQPDCRDRLRRMLASEFPADVVVVTAPDRAAQAIGADRPDVVLVSALLPPRLEEQVMRRLKEIDPNGRVPVLTVPPAVTTDASGRARGIRTIFAFARRPEPWLPYDPVALTGRIRETLRAIRNGELFGASPASNLPALRPAAASPAPACGAPPAKPLALVAGASLAAAAPRVRQRRAHRISPAELPWPLAMTTPHGVAVRLVNVSATGVLFESSLKFRPESEAALCVFGPETKLTVPARFVRSEVSSVDSSGVKYLTAAAFEQKVELFKPAAPELGRPGAALQALADLLLRVTSDCMRNGDRDAARAEFEAGMRRLLPGCEVRLRDAIVRPTSGCESIYFTVPAPRGAVLQATFDPDHEPTPEEFTLLRAAAAAASVVVQLGPTASLPQTA